MRLAGPRLLSDTDVLFAIAGEVDARIVGEAGTRAVTAWRSHRLHAGEELRVDAVRSGVAYLAFAGGIEGRRELGCRSRYERADLGSPLPRPDTESRRWLAAGTLRARNGDSAPPRHRAGAPRWAAPGHPRAATRALQRCRLAEFSRKRIRRRARGRPAWACASTGRALNTSAAPTSFPTR
ncbi:MAG: hypothetical protein IPH39_00075 [Sulfuritalea sp.]|nr:hypothetical protein [Sulfuritalea sp.]